MTLGTKYANCTVRYFCILFPADDNIFEVYKEVHTLAPRWSDICWALNLPHEETIRNETQGVDCKRCLRMVLRKWLQKSYNYKKYGSPTWRMLVEAVGNSSGGDDGALANAMARKHTGMYMQGTQILWLLSGQLCTNVSKLLFSTFVVVFFYCTLVVRRATFPGEVFYREHQVQDSVSQPPAKRPRLTATPGESPIETWSIDIEELEQSTKFSSMLTKVTELLNKSADVENLKFFLKSLCHPRTHQRYIDIKLYDHCRTPREIIETLFPQYINFMNIHLLRVIVDEFGDEKSKPLLKQYEDNFPCMKPLKCMCHPLSDKEIEACTGTKKVIIEYRGVNVDTTTMEDVEKVRQIIERNTKIGQIVIVYANQTPGSVIFTFLVPEIVVGTFSDLDEENQRDLADHGILKIEVNDVVIDLQSSQPGIKIDTSQAWTRTSQGGTKTLHPETKTDTSQTVTNTDVSTYTTSGIKRVPLTHDNPPKTHCSSEFQQLISEVKTSLAVSVDTNELKRFLHSFSHLLYPEAKYIDLSLLDGAESIPQIFTFLQPLLINFLNWGVLRKVADAFDIEIASTFQLYKSKFPPHTKLSTLPDPLSEEDFSEFRGFQKLRVTCTGDSGIEWTLGDVHIVKEAVEKATGIDQAFIIYAYWEGGFTSHQFTFLIPKAISEIFRELCEEDLTILAKKGVQSLEIDYDIVADDVQKLYAELPHAEAIFMAADKMVAKSFEFEHSFSEEQMSEEKFSHLKVLITSTPTDKLQEICSNDCLKKFSKMMGNWKDLAPYLGISESSLEDLAEDYRGNEEEQKFLALLNWKEIDVNSATYERLVECLLTHGHIDDAKELLLQLQGQQQQFVWHFVSTVYDVYTVISL